MKTRLVIALGLLCLLPAAAQEKKEEKARPTGPIETRLFELKYADPRAVMDLITGLRQFGYAVNWSEQLRAISVSAPPFTLASVAETIKRLDVPSTGSSSDQQDVDLTVYLVLASTQAGQAEATPKALDPVIQELKNTFSYRSFRVLDTALLRSRSGTDATTSGIVSVGSEPQKSTYSLFIRPQITGQAQSRLIRLEPLRFSMRVPVPTGSGGFTYMDTGLTTAINVRENQMVVVGKSNVGGPDQALILILRARVQP